LVEVFGVPFSVNVRVVFGLTGFCPVTSPGARHDTETAKPVVAVRRRPVTLFERLRTLLTGK
jgi:hypothetical protein